MTSRTRNAAWGSLLLAGLLAFVDVGPAHAQAIDQVQEQRELEYQAALNAFQAAQASRGALQSRLEQWSDSMAVARVANNEERKNRAYAALLPITRDLLSADRRVEETVQSLEQARFALRDLIDKRMDLLVEQIEFAGTDDERRNLALQYEDLNNRFYELAPRTAEEMRVTAVLLPNIMAAPTDGPTELSAKAELLERFAAKFDTLAATISDELEGVERRTQRERSMNGFMAGIDRFGDANVPVGPARGVPEREDGGDLSLEDQQEELRALLQRYEELSAEARARSVQLKQLAGEIVS